MLGVSSNEPEWDSATTARIGGEIRRLRGKRSAQQIADRTTALGYPIGRATISELETGRRKSITVPELLILAAALDVPPILLLCPGLPDGPVEILPGLETTAIVAAEWFEGRDEAVRLQFEGGDETTAAAIRADMQAVRRFVQLDRQARGLELLIHLKAVGVEHLQDREIDPQAVAQVRAELAEVAALLRGRGYAVDGMRERNNLGDTSDGDD